MDTKPEVLLRSALHLAGLRFRKDYSILTGATRVRADVVFPTLRVAIFVDGCFWHGCPRHGNVPISNSDYWGPKLARNRQRDRRNTRDLRRAGWTVLRFWEHTPPAIAVRRIQRKLEELEKKGLRS